MKSAPFDYGVAAALGVIGATAVVLAPSYGIMPNTSVLGTGTLPLVVGLCLVVLSVLSIVTTARQRAATLSKPQAEDENPSLVRPALILGMTVIAAVMVSYIGFIAAATCLVIALMMLEKVGPIRAVIIGGFMAAAIQLLFVFFLRVPLP